MTRTSLTLTTLLLGGLASSGGATLAPLPEGARLERLDNGLEVLLLHIPDAPMTGLNMLVKTGSHRESFRTSGMTHMLEHLLFNGTTKWSQEELYARQDMLGAYNNANTGRHYTNYMVLVPAADLEGGMELQSQMLFHSTLPPEKFEKERGIVMEELAQGGDDPAQAVESLWEDFLYAGSSYAMPTLGTPATIRHLDRASVDSYYHSWYVPNNMLLSVVGAFDPATILDQVKTWYGDMAPGDLPESHPAPLQWRPNESRRREAAVPVRRLRLAWPGPDSSHPDDLAAGLLAWAAGDPRDGVLPRLLFLEGLPPMENLRLSHVGDPGFGRFELEADLPADMEAQDAIQGLCQALSRLKDESFPPALIAQRVLEERSNLAQLMEKPHYFGLMEAATFAEQGFEASLTRGARLAQLRPEDLQACAARWLRGGEPMALLLEPAATVDAEDDAASRDQIRRPGGVDQAALLIEGGRPSQVFALQAVVRGRAVWEGEGKAGAISLIHRLMPEGAAGQDAAALAERLRRMGGKLSLADNAAIPYDDHYTSSSHSFLRLEVLGEHWQAACSLAVDLLLAPDFPEEAVERLRDRQLEQLGHQEGSARSRSRQLLDSLMLAGLPSALPPEGKTESVASLTVEDLRRIHRLAFRPENLILAVVGPVSAPEVEQCLDGLLAGHSSTATQEDLEWLRGSSPWMAPVADARPLWPPRLEAPVTPAPLQLNESLGGEMQALRLSCRMEVEESDGAALRLLVALLSDRMAFDLRETRGWAYSIGAGASVAGRRAVVDAYMGTRAENSSQALKEMRRYLGALDKPVTQVELDKVRGGMLGRDLMRGLASINQAWRLAMGELAGGASVDEEAALRAVTPQDVTRVAQRYLATAPWITVHVE
jgi:predicted Zn-dependent peptidase